MVYTKSPFIPRNNAVSAELVQTELCVRRVGFDGHVRRCVVEMCVAVSTVVNNVGVNYAEIAV